MSNADTAIKNIVDPLIGKTSPAERDAEKKMKEQERQFSQQARRMQEKERAQALEENIRKRKTSGTAVRNFVGLGGSSSSGSTLG